MSAGHRDLQPDTRIAPTITGMMAQHELTIGEVVGERFRVLRILGMGGMGLVYQAHDTELDIDVALKLLRPELASRPDAFERFRKELLLARQVSSPHVVRIHDLVRHKQAWLISMDYVAGQSLERLLSEQKTLDPERALQITRQLALGLAAAHHSRVVHRDLKPANVLVNEQGDVSITDFGVARIAGETGMTGSGVVIGTPEYLSPEQAKAEPLDGRSDLYALGLILFEMLTGTLPFRGGTPAEMLVQRIVRDPPSANTIRAGLPPFAVKLCAGLLELRVIRRIQTAEEVVQAIDNNRLPKAFSRPQRRLRVYAGVVLAVVAMLAVVVYRRAENTDPALIPVAIATQSEVLDLLPLPWASDDNPEDLALVTGIRRLWADQLSLDPKLRSADPLRVDRALIELGYDASAADRQHQRVLEVIGAKLALEGEVRHQGEGWVLMLRLVNASSATPQWSTQVLASNTADLPNALAALSTQLDERLRLGRRPPVWPDAEALRVLGTISNMPGAGADFEAMQAQTQRLNSAELWWLSMYTLDRAGRNAEAEGMAASAREGLTDTNSLMAQRTLGYAQLLLGESEAARSRLMKVAEAAPRDHPSRLLLARSEAELGNFEIAMDQLKQLVKDDPRNLDAWYALGKYSIQSGDAKSAVDEYLVRAQVLANRLRDARMRADVTNAMGIGYRRLGQMDAAAEQSRLAVSQRADLGDIAGQAASLRNLATVFSIRGEFDEAQGALSEARALIEHLGDSGAMADLANDVGVLSEERGDYRAALAAYRDGLRLRQVLGDQRSIGESLNNVGFAYYQLGEFDNAQTYWQQSEATYGEIDDRFGLVHARQSLALAEMARGDWSSARELLDDSLSIAESLQMAEERAISLATLAELDRLEGKMDSAQHRAGAALIEFQRRNDPRGINEMHLLRSAIASDLGDWAGAAAAIDDLSIDTVAEQASVLHWRRAEIALGEGRITAALSAADSAIAQAVAARSYASEISARLVRATALHASGDQSGAEAELGIVEDGLVRYASVPLQLRKYETALLVLNGSKAAASYREAGNLLARLPSYSRAFVIHQLGSQAAVVNSAAAQQARALAALSLAQVLNHTPATQQRVLRDYAASLGIVLKEPSG